MKFDKEMVDRGLKNPVVQACFSKAIVPGLDRFSITQLLGGLDQQFCFAGYPKALYTEPFWESLDHFGLKPEVWNIVGPTMEDLSVLAVVATEEDDKRERGGMMRALTSSVYLGLVNALIDDTELTDGDLDKALKLTPIVWDTVITCHEGKDELVQPMKEMSSSGTGDEPAMIPMYFYDYTSSPVLIQFNLERRDEDRVLMSILKLLGALDLSKNEKKERLLDLYGINLDWNREQSYEFLKEHPELAEKYKTVY